MTTPHVSGDHAPINHQVRLASRPIGMVSSENFAYTEEPIPEPADGQALVKMLYLSLDPGMRGWMDDARSYIPPVGIGEVMRAGGIGIVVASRHPDLPVGTYLSGVSGSFGVQEYALSDGAGVLRIDPSLAELPTHLGVLGMTGLTAYFGLLDVGQPRPGDTVVVSGAAGAVGMVAGQIAKLKGCRVIGIAGGSAKCDYLVSELGFDAAIDYKSQDVKAELRKHCPNGIDVYFDNVGGDILDIVLTRLARGARVVLCGFLSTYNSTDAKGLLNYRSLLVNRASMTGFVIFDYAPRYEQVTRELAGWLAAGQLKAREEVVEGIAHFPEALQRMFNGEHTGKLVLKVADE